jgi:RNA polymerase sigma-70 factor, ECF subfamily
MASARSGHEFDLLKRSQQPDLASPDEIFALYARRLTSAAESSLSHQRDAQDVLQSVFRAFFRRGARETCRIGNSGPGWRLLVKIMPVDPRAKNRHQTTEKRATVAEAAGPPEGSSNEARARVTTPGKAAVVAEFEAALHGLPLIYSRILDLRLHGWSASKIARRLGTSRQTVYRALDLLRQRLKDAHASCRKFETPV